jgi:hypothetical protein
MKKLSKKRIKEFLKNDICEIPILYSNPNIAFSIAEDFKGRVCVPCWYDCREIFHADYPRANHIFVNHKKTNCGKIENFLLSIEDMLGISKKSKYYKTGRKTVSMFLLSSFWNNEIRFTLLTLLLRTAGYYNMSKYNNRIFSRCKYLSETKNAVNIFMDGNFKYNGNMYSWYKQFKHLSIKECKKLLQKQ